MSVSIPVVRRLPRYYRFLKLLKSNGIVRISSKKLAEMMELGASQIRQDLNCFGGFGQQGYGYNVEALLSEIEEILGLDKSLKTVLIGAGNLGKVLTLHMNFMQSGFDLIGIFDSKKKTIGKAINGKEVLSVDKLEAFCKKHKPEAAILTLPKEAAQGVADKLISLGIKGFWNFSHYDLSSPYPDIAVENVHLGDSLMTLSYRIKNLGEKADI